MKSRGETSRLGDVSLIIHSGDMSMAIYLATRDVENWEHVRIAHANEFRLNGMNNPRCELKRAKITENKDHEWDLSRGYDVAKCSRAVSSNARDRAMFIRMY